MDGDSNEFLRSLIDIIPGTEDAFPWISSTSAKAASSIDESVNGKFDASMPSSTSSQGKLFSPQSSSLTTAPSSDIFQERGRKKESCKERWNRLVGSISGRIFLFSLVALITLIVVCYTTAWVLIIGGLRNVWAAVHKSHLTLAYQMVNFRTNRVRIVETHVNEIITGSHGRRINYGGDAMVGLICKALMTGDRGTFVMLSIWVASVANSSFTYCERQGYGISQRAAAVQVVNDPLVSNGSGHFINSTDFRYAIPLEVAFETTDFFRNITQQFQNFTDTVYKDFIDYYAGAPVVFDEAQMWHLVHTDDPATFWYTFPLPDFSTPAVASTGIPDSSAFVSVMGHASDVFYQVSTLGMRTMLLDVSSTHADLDDPFVISVNWDEPALPGPSTPTSPSSVRNLHASEITDKLMKEALSHVDLAALTRSAGYMHNSKYFHHGGIHVLTAQRFTTSTALEYGLIVLSIQNEVSPPNYPARFIGLLFVPLVVSVVCLAVLAILLYVSLHAPLAELESRLRESVRFGQRFYCSVERGWFLVKEVIDLMGAYNDLIYQLRQLDKHVDHVEVFSGSAGSSSDGGSGFVQQTALQIKLRENAGKPVSATTVCVFFGYTRAAGTEETAPEAKAEGNVKLVTSIDTINEKRNAAALQRTRVMATVLEAVVELAEQHNGTIVYKDPQACRLVFIQKGLKVMSAKVHDPIRAEATRDDARSAACFMLDLQQKLGDLWGTHWHAIADSSDTFVLSPYSTSFPSVLGRDLDVELYSAIVMIGARLLLSEETAKLVEGRVRMLPTEVLFVRGPNRDTREDVLVVLWELLPGTTRSVGWRDYSRLYSSGFERMIQGKYGEALDNFDEAAMLSNAPPDLLPPSEGVLDDRDDDRKQNIVQMGRLMEVCAQRLRVSDSTPFRRLRLSPEEVYMRTHWRFANRHDELPSVLLDSFNAHGGGPKAEPQPELLPFGIIDVKRAMQESNRSLHEVPGTTTRFLLDGPRMCVDNHRVLWTPQYLSLTMTSPIPEWVVVNELAELATAIFLPFREVRTATGAVVDFSLYELGPHTTVPPLQSTTKQRRVMSKIQTNVRAEFLRDILGHTAVEGGVVLFVEYGVKSSLTHLLVHHDWNVPSEIAMRCVTPMLQSLYAVHSTGKRHGWVSPDAFFTNGSSCVFRLLQPFPDGPTAMEMVYSRFTVYMSPEEASGEPVTQASDIFCFGLVLVVLLFPSAEPWRWASDMVGSGEAALPAVLANERLFRNALRRGELEPSLPLRGKTDVDQQLYRLVEQCLATVPQERPKTADVLSFFVNRN